MGSGDLQGARFFERHRWLSLILVNLVLLALLLGIAELVARSFIDYSIGYYRSVKDPGIYEFAYGEVRINSLGFADDDFDLRSEKPRIGYFGDSVNFGVGAGYGHRISDLLAEAFPRFEHWNLGGGSGSSIGHQRMAERAREFDLAAAVFLLNLNDLGQHVVTTETTGNRPLVWHIRRHVLGATDFLRGRSYLYNWMRMAVRNAYYRAGFGISGQKAYELWPGENPDVIASMCESLNEAKASLAAVGAEFCVILLPYEMQISEDAARTYRQLGFSWEEGFEAGSTQARLRECLDFETVYDPRPAFDRAAAEVGEYFVFNRGDALDWNHPNRAGHRRIAEGFAASGTCPILSDTAQPATAGLTAEGQTGRRDPSP